MMSLQFNLDKLQDWAEDIGAEVAVYRNRRCPADGGGWCWDLRVRYHWCKQQSIRTASGDDIEAVATELLPLAKDAYANMKDFWDKGRKQADKKHQSNLRKDMADIKRMHMNAGDF